MENRFSKDNFLILYDEVIKFQLKILYPLVVEKEPTRINLLFLNHDRNLSTFLTIKYLVEHERVADIYTLSRSMFESIINMGLLCKSLITDDLDRYQNFQYLEIFKTHEHLKRIGLERLNGISNSEFDIVKKNRTDYIRRWGNNETSWTGKSLEANVKLVDSAYQPTCEENHFYEYLYCQVYRKGSQSTHSSFAGLSKGIIIEKVPILGNNVQRFATNEAHLIFSCFHSVLVFLSSVRFLGTAVNKLECESYFQKKASYIISEI